MKLTKILILLCLFCLLLAGCGDTADPAVNPEETTVPEEKEMLVLMGGADAYTLIRDEDFGKIGTDAAVELHKLFDYAIGIDTDWVQRGAEPAFGSFEILIGPTNRPESVAMTETLGEHDYCIAVEGKKLVISGGTETGTAAFLRIQIRPISASNCSQSSPSYSKCRHPAGAFPGSKAGSAGACLEGVSSVCIYKVARPRACAPAISVERSLPIIRQCSGSRFRSRSRAPKKRASGFRQP